jgi:hypothetical protein
MDNRHELTMDACIKEYESVVSGIKSVTDMNFDSCYIAPPQAITRKAEDIIIFENLSDKEKIDLLFELAKRENQSLAYPTRNFL